MGNVWSLDFGFCDPFCDFHISYQFVVDVAPLYFVGVSRLMGGGIQYCDSGAFLVHLGFAAVGFSGSIVAVVAVVAADVVVAAAAVLVVAAAAATVVVAVVALVAAVVVAIGAVAAAAVVVAADSLLCQQQVQKHDS